MFLRVIFCFLVLFIAQNTCLAQEGGNAPKKEQSMKSKRKLRKEDRKKWKEDRKNKRLEEKKVRDHHKRIQTKEVRKRMKRSKQTAARNRDHKREPFFQRVFKKKGKRVKPSKEKSSKVKQ